MATELVSHFVAHFVAMAQNNAWANHRLLSACEALTAAEFADARSMRLAQTGSDRRLIAVCENQTDETLAADCILLRPNRKPPQLDEFFLPGKEDLRRDELRALGPPET